MSLYSLSVASVPPFQVHFEEAFDLRPMALASRPLPGPAPLAERRTGAPARSPRAVGKAHPKGPRHIAHALRALKATRRFMRRLKVTSQDVQGL